MVAVMSALVVAACGPDGPIELPRVMPGPSAVEFPIELWDMGLEGETVLLLHVTDAGVVDSVVVDGSSGFEDFDSAAVQGARVMRFSPARQDSERIAVWIRVPVRFSRDRLPDTGSASPTGPTGQESR